MSAPGQGAGRWVPAVRGVPALGPSRQRGAGRRVPAIRGVLGAGAEGNPKPEIIWLQNK